MYPPPYYTDNAPAFTAGVMREHSFAVLTMVDRGGAISATHLPFVLKDEGPNGTLYGHISKSNPQAKLLDGQHRAMVVFSGPHAYISASWYDHPEKQVPTWNYISVQATGTPTALPREDYMAEMVTLVTQYEPDDAWTINNAKDYAEKIMNGIIYFKMDIQTIQGARKMSANKNKAERTNVIKQLIMRGETDTAAAMASIHT